MIKEYLNLVEINGDSRWTYNTNSQIEFKSMALNSRLCDYSDVKTLVKRTITVTNTTPTDAAGGPNDREKIIFKSCAPFTDYINETNSTQVNNTKHTDVVLLMYNLIKYSNNYSKMSGRL